ncbi:hypothetical protein Hanom_Chr05g00427231 [Helianthus anomalus]
MTSVVTVSTTSPKSNHCFSHTKRVQNSFSFTHTEIQTMPSSLLRQYHHPSIAAKHLGPSAHLGFTSYGG